MATEKRLIDANALEEAITTDYWEHFTQCHDTDQIALIDMVREDIGNAPTVDAVEVLRCKDCEFFSSNSCIGIMPGYGFEVSPMDFCSKGERRTDNGC